MAMTADMILERVHLKSRIRFWKAMAVIAACIVLLLVFFGDKASLTSLSGQAPLGKFIARIEIQDLIFEDRYRQKKLQQLRDDTNAQAVIVYINSPGGTIVGGENLYYTLRQIAEKKPVVAVMGSLATSGGYMVAIAADHIFARKGTLTGSIGVILQTAEFTDLAQKVGVNFINFKSGSLKGVPSPLEKLTGEGHKVIQAAIADSYNTFLDMVIERRQLTKGDVQAIGDGRVFTGNQAMALKLIDQIGGQEEAIAWLKTEKELGENLPVRDVSLKKKQNVWDEMMVSWLPGSLSEMLTGSELSRSGKEGLMALWVPSL